MGLLVYFASLPAAAAAPAVGTLAGQVPFEVPWSAVALSLVPSLEVFRRS